MLKKIKLVSVFFAVLSIIPLVLLPFLAEFEPISLRIYIVYAVFFYIFALIILLLAYKKADSSTKLAEYTKLLAWELPEGFDAKRITLKRTLIRNTIILLACIILIVAILVLLTDLGIISAVCIFLAAFTLIFSSVLYITVFEYTKNGENKRFMLCHNLLLLAGAKTVLDGKSNAIYDVNYNSDAKILNLGLMQGQKNGNISIPVPDEEIQNVRQFITDLNAHFEKIKQENENNIITEGK